ncbi:Single-pass membrane and coiled-coil domain-containing protein 3 [Labeo rohita]|nr:uncharacterized protein LOC127157680 isoform X1 [Labeo rohita]KAI2647686.1 Single-pass membrane and coiled-coil domain-containing protein 3 [Labeo rohita]
MQCGIKLLSLLFGKKDELKKEELIRSTQTLHHYVHKYFSITNRLLEILNAHLNQSPSDAIEPNESESIEKNCARVRNVMQAILDLSESENKHVQKEKHDLYSLITTSEMSLEDKAKQIKDLNQKTMGTLGEMFGPVVVVRLANSDLMNAMPPVESRESLLLTPGDLVQSSAKITKLLSKPESLDDALQLVQDALFALTERCDSYNDILCEVEAYVAILSETCKAIL